VTGFVNIILKLVESLGYDAGQALLGYFAAGFEVVPHERARGAGLVVGELPGKPSRLPRIPQHPVAGPDMEAIWDDRGQPARQNLGQPIRIDIHARILRPSSPQRDPKPTYSQLPAGWQQTHPLCRESHGRR
jgi:hypothetical protein